MADFNMGTARGRITIDYDENGMVRFTQDMDRVQESAERHNSKLGNMISLLTLVGAQAGLAGAAIVTAGAAIGAAFVSAGAALGAFGIAAGPQLGAATEAAKLHEEAVKAQAAGAANAGEKMKAYKDSLAALPPATRGTAVALVGLKASFKSWSDSLAGTTMPIFTRGLNVLKGLIPALTPLVKVAASALGDMMTKIEQGVAGGGVQAFTSKLAGMASTTLPALLNTLKNVGIGIGGLVNAFLPAGDAMSGTIEDLTAKFAAWGQSLGSSSGFKTFMDQMKTAGPQVASVLGDLGRTILNLIQALAPFAGATLLITTAFASLVAAIPVPVLQVLATVITTITVAMKLWALTILIVNAATKAWAIAQAILNVALTANPIGLIVIAIAALIAIIVLIATKTTWFQTIWSTVWNGIKMVFSAVVGAIVAFARANWQMLVTIFSGPLNAIKGVVTKSFNAIKSFVTSAVSTVVNFVRNHWRLIISIIGGPLGLAVALVTKHWNSIKSFISSAVNAVLGVVRKFGSGIMAAIRAVGAIVGIISGIFSRFRSAISSRISSALSLIRKVPGQIRSVFSGAAGWLVGIGRAIIDGLINGIKSAIGRVKDLLNSVTGLIPDWKGPMTKDKKLLTPTGRKIIDGLIKGIVRQLPVLKKLLGGVTTQTIQTGVVQRPSGAGGGLEFRSAPIVAQKNVPPDWNAISRVLSAELRRAGLGAVQINGKVISDIVSRETGRRTAQARRTR